MNFVVMMTMLVFVTTTKTQLVEANQHFFSLRQCALSISSTLIECKITNPASTFLGVEMRLWLPWGLWGHTSVLQSPKSQMSMVHALTQFWGPF